ncbi:MAG: polysaccharide deacetylase family protein [Candidatus Hydrogenedentes bacterium]|nr:polysaccharide deacetylase family protein [Candidatus Hydrogenedentota bacterium]
MDSVTRRNFLETTVAITALAAGPGRARADDGSDVGATGYRTRSGTEVSNMLESGKPKVYESTVRPGFTWPEGKRMAVSMSFDDARPSQVDVAFPLLEDFGVKATFYVCPDNLEKRVDDWRAVASAGHELGNHTVSHPCSGNFEFSRGNALESYTLDDMEKEMVECNRRVETACGVVPATFAYPCGNTFVGHGKKVRSYVPLVAKHFLAGRGFPSEWHNAPAVCDLAQLNGVSFDGLDFNTILGLIDKAGADGAWLVLAGHDAGDEDARQVTRCDTLRAVCEYALEPDHGIWLDTVAAVAKHLRDWQAENKRQRKKTETR